MGHRRGLGRRGLRPRVLAAQLRRAARLPELSAEQVRRLERVAESCPVRRALEDGFTFEERLVTDRADRARRLEGRRCAASCLEPLRLGQRRRRRIKATDSPPINAATRAIPATARPLMPSSSWCKGRAEAAGPVLAPRPRFIIPGPIPGPHPGTAAAVRRRSSRPSVWSSSSTRRRGNRRSRS